MRYAYNWRMATASSGTRANTWKVSLILFGWLYGALPLTSHRGVQDQFVYSMERRTVPGSYTLFCPPHCGGIYREPLRHAGRQSHLQLFTAR